VLIASIGKAEVLEFFSGVGGLHFAFKQALKELEVDDNNDAANSTSLPFTSRSGFRVQSFDLSTVANSVYAHNFPSDPPPYHRDLCLVSSEQLGNTSFKYLPTITPLPTIDDNDDDDDDDDDDDTDDDDDDDSEVRMIRNDDIAIRR